jgi:AAA domain
LNVEAIMFSPAFECLPMNRLDVAAKARAADWLWEGYVARGAITLLISQWKTGKTTLMTGLIQRLGDGRPFLDRRCKAGNVLIVSEESSELWGHRMWTMPVGPHAQLVSQPFRSRPTPETWNALVDRAASMREEGNLDLFVVDPLASFLPGNTESDSGTLMEMLHPLQRLAAMGVAILILHHPRQRASAEGTSARGGRALLECMDITIELRRFGRPQSDDRRRKLTALSRHSETSRNLFYEWNPATGEFQIVTDSNEKRFREHWPHMQAILAKRTTPATHREVLMDWPIEIEKPPASVLYRWLNRAAEEGLVERTGTGARDKPYRYALPEGERNH